MADIELKNVVATSAGNDEKPNTDTNEMMGVYALGAFQAVLIILLWAICEYDETGSGKSATPMAGHQYAMFQDVHVMIFIGFGFLMTFMKKYSFSAVGFNFLLAAVTIQWATIAVHYAWCLFKDDPNNDAWSKKIGINLEVLICGDFVAGAVLISFGALLGKASMTQLVVMMFFECIFFGINEGICTVSLGLSDCGGSLIVHTFGAYFGLAASYVLTNKDKVEAAGDKFGSVYNSDIFAMVGTVFLWMFWPSFNGALGAASGDGHRVVVNTVLALSACCISAMVTSRVLQPGNKLSMVDVQNATLAGGVAVGTSANLMISPGGAATMGFIAGVISVFGYVKVSPFLEDKIGLHDTCGVHNLHGMPGLLGGLFGAISMYAMPAENWAVTGGSTPAGETKALDQSGQGTANLISIFITLAMAIFTGGLTGFIMKQCPSAVVYGDDAASWLLEDEEEAPAAAAPAPALELKEQDV